jgi:diguanylate cyclase (GGDEF)-like protein
LLKQISIRFSRILPPNALLARLGGDEFGVIIFGTNNDSYEVAQALRAALSYPFALPHATVSVGVSIGRVVQNDAKYLPEDLLRHADHAMYVAKRGQLGLVDWEETNSPV